MEGFVGVGAVIRRRTVLKDNVMGIEIETEAFEHFQDVLEATVALNIAGIVN